MSFCHKEADIVQKVEAIIRDQFSKGPGANKVFAGEYELFNTLDCSQLLSKSELEVLLPGMRIKMAIIVGQYGERSLERCPRVGCRSAKTTANEAGDRIWYGSLVDEAPLKI